MLKERQHLSSTASNGALLCCWLARAARMFSQYDKDSFLKLVEDELEAASTRLGLEKHVARGSHGPFCLPAMQKCILL
eukprot:1159500-Pelagomonas_calceolata.AAC.27